ncbi:MAG: ABC transporter ATP-binding protein [Clostridia bacterium]|nr:ABC transporter ATP-binding protein [Clostridia bacterium]MBR2414111.1 ABC transporter ATP-binding protein [Clostridia bacterium]MBR3955265.1 ABC transporter ATP-binding protein [Clostridia bacterium]
MSFIELNSVYKKYQTGEVVITALDGVTFSVEQGELCIVVGPSGAGKTTVLNILGGIDDCDDGKVRVGGELINNYNSKNLALYRRHDVGFVFQFYNLVPNLTALENVELASQISNKALNPTRVLERVGLGDRLHNFPAQLSGGEQQRVSIARALAKNPKLLLCDEPTGALDYATGKQILSLLQETSKETGMTVVIITHNQALTPMADRVISMRNGRVQRITVNDNPLSVEQIEW